MLNTSLQKQNNDKAMENINFLPCGDKTDKDIQYSGASNQTTKSSFDATASKTDKLFDDELEMLLSLDNKNKQLSQQTTGKHRKKSFEENVEEIPTPNKHFVQQIEKEPINHSLKELHTDSREEDQASMSDIIDSTQKETSLKKEENLEDWLDSVLGT